MMSGKSGAPPPAPTVEYLVGVVKDWTQARFAATQSSKFVFAAHRFELTEDGFRRICLPEDSPEANDPLDAVPRVSTPTVWSHSTVVSVLTDSDAETLEFEQEVIEILAMEGDAVRGGSCRGDPACLDSACVWAPSAGRNDGDDRPCATRSQAAPPAASIGKGSLGAESRTRQVRLSAVAPVHQEGTQR
jgi:hypothetical protein